MSNMLAINVARFRRFPESRSRGNWDLPRLGLFASQEVGVGDSGSPQNLILRVIPIWTHEVTPIWTHEVTPNLVPGIIPNLVLASPQNLDLKIIPILIHGAIPNLLGLPQILIPLVIPNVTSEVISNLIPRGPPGVIPKPDPAVTPKLILQVSLNLIHGVTLKPSH